MHVFCYTRPKTVTENTQDIRRESVEKRMQAAKADEPKVDADGNPTPRELNKQLGRDDFDAPGASRLSQRFITSNNIKEDEELIKNAKVGQVVTLSNGKKYKRTLAQPQDPGIVTDKENSPPDNKQSNTTSNTSIAPGPAVNVQQTIPANNAAATATTSSANNGYSANVTVDPKTNAVTFDFNGKKVDASKAASGYPVMKMKNDGDDYIRQMGNFETLMGSSSGGSVTGYGFSGANPDLAKLFKNAKGSNNEEKFINSVNDYIIGQDNGKKEYGGKQTILTDLGISRSEFDALPEDVRKELVDWKFNSGRGTTDLVLIASGGDWDGDRAFRLNSPTSAELVVNDPSNPGKKKPIDLKNLDVAKLKAARQELYKKRIDGLKNGIALFKSNPKAKGAFDPNAKPKNSTKTYAEILEFAEDGYNNSQKYR